MDTSENSLQEPGVKVPVGGDPLELLDALPEDMDTAVSRALDAMEMRYVIHGADIDLLLQAGLRMEVVEAGTPHFVPHAPAWCDGLLNLRGELLPIIALHRLLSDSPDSMEKHTAYLLVIRPADSAAVAITLQRLPEKIRFTEASRTPLPSGIPAGISVAIPAAYDYQGRVFLEFDHIALLDSLQGGGPSTQPG